MEIPDPEIKVQKGGAKRDIRPDEASIIVAETAGGLIGAQGSLNVLNHIKEIFLNEDNNRRSNLPNIYPPLDTPESELEKFIKADYPSHLLKVAELESFINMSKQGTKIIDETDVSGASLWDYIEPEVQDEILSQLEGLKSTAALKDSLKTELESLVSGTWESHKETKSGTENQRFEHYEAMLLGKDPKIKDKRDLRSIKDDILKAEEVHEMLTFEKMRMVMATTTCPLEEKPLKESEAFDVMGEEFALIKSQMEHLEKMMETDWAKCIPEDGIIDPAKGESLICPEMATRLEGNASQEQIKALEEAYVTMAGKRFPGTNGRDKLAEKTAFCLASMQFLELGKKAKFMNAMKDIRSVTKEKIEDLEKNEGPTPPPLPDELDPKKEMADKGAERASKGIGRMIKACPAVLAAQIWVMTKDKSKTEYSGHYGSMADAVQFAQQVGMSRIDEPM
jgi:hypothetical protein